MRSSSRLSQLAALALAMTAMNEIQAAPISLPNRSNEYHKGKRIAQWKLDKNQRKQYRR